VKRIFITLLAAASFAQANTRAELDELLARQRGETATSFQAARKPRIAYWRVHYSIRGSGRDITVLAESSSEARQVVMDMFPGAVVTNVRRITR
jgi:hypothetical protein